MTFLRCFKTQPEAQNLNRRAAHPADYGSRVELRYDESFESPGWARPGKPAVAPQRSLTILNLTSLVIEQRNRMALNSLVSRGSEFNSHVRIASQVQ
jgi:hypothetical protein